MAVVSLIKAIVMLLQYSGFILLASSDNYKHMRQKTQQEYNSKGKICYLENICRIEHPFTPRNLPRNRQLKTSLLSKRFRLVSEQRKTGERDFRF